MQTKMRGFAEFTNTPEGALEAENYKTERMGEGMTCMVAYNPASANNPHDNLLVRWYNPKYFRGFKVRK